MANERTVRQANRKGREKTLTPRSAGRIEAPMKRPSASLDDPAALPPPSPPVTFKGAPVGALKQHARLTSQSSKGKRD